MAAQAVSESTATGRSRRIRLTPHACSATNSRSADRRPNPMSKPNSSDIGIVTPRAIGSRVAITRTITVADTPLATSSSAISMRYGMIKMNVKISRPIDSGQRT